MLNTGAMVYRKAPRNPPRLLLRIAGAAGAGALVGIAACSSSSGPDGSTGLMGSVAQADGGSGTGDDGSVGEHMLLGSLPSCGPNTNEPECPCVAAVSPDGCDAATSDIPDALPLTPDANDGATADPSDGAIDGMVFHGILANPDASDASDASDATIFNGIVAHPGDGG